MIATGQEMIRENKFFLRSGKVRKFQFEPLKDVRKTSNIKSIFVHFTDMNRVVLVEYFS